MVVVQSYLNKSDCYNENRTITVKGLILNSVGCPQPSAKVLCNNWNRPGKKICLHALIDANDGKVYQTLRWNARGWHCSGSANDTHIGVSMCEPATIRYTSPEVFTVSGDKSKAAEAVKRTYVAAVELFGQLCVKYHLDPMTSIFSRKEAVEKGIASKAGSPEVLWKGLSLSYTMDGFRKDVSLEVNRLNNKIDAKVEAAKDETSAAVDKKEEMEIVDEKKSAENMERKVKINVDNLRIRTGPGTNYPTTGRYTGKGVFGISEIQNGSGANKGWGKLKDGSGWIMLDYVIML